MSLRRQQGTWNLEYNDPFLTFYISILYIMLCCLLPVFFSWTKNLGFVVLLIHWRGDSIKKNPTTQAILILTDWEDGSSWRWCSFGQRPSTHGGIDWGKIIRSLSFAVWEGFCDRFYHTSSTHSGTDWLQNYPLLRRLGDFVTDARLLLVRTLINTICSLLFWDINKKYLYFRLEDQLIDNYGITHNFVSEKFRRNENEKILPE